MANKEVMKHTAYYSMRPGIVLRDIGGYYFLIDIKNKYCYTLKELFTLNEMGVAIVEHVHAIGTCTMAEITSYVVSLLMEYDESMYEVIYSDCTEFVEKLVKMNYAVCKEDDEGGK